MPDIQTTEQKAAQVEKVSGEFLTKDALTSGSHWKREEGELYLPELGGKVWVRGVSFREQRQILSHVRESSPGSLKSTAFQLSRYVTKPSLTEDEWAKILSDPDLPATAVNRINQRIGKIMLILEEDEDRLVDEFPGADD